MRWGSMQSLKIAQKQAREYMNKTHWLYSYISFTNQKGYYFTPAYEADNYAVFLCRRNGALEELKTDYARHFFQYRNDWRKRE